MKGWLKYGTSFQKVRKQDRDDVYVDYKMLYYETRPTLQCQGYLHLWLDVEGETQDIV